MCQKKLTDEYHMSNVQHLERINATVSQQLLQ